MIELEHIKKTFKTDPGTVTAIDDVTLHIQQGEIFGVIGFSGAGKSTLVRCINLLERPQSGCIRIDGDDITHYEGDRLRAIRQRIGMIFQHFNLMPSRTVYENIELPLKLTTLTASERQTKIEKLLHLVGLSDKKSTFPSQLSGGQKQRVAIARALANDPKILLCDEATSALDPQTTQSILQLLAEVNRTLKITVVIITHQMDVIKAVCDRVAVMQAGKIVELGPVDEIFASPQAPITKDFIGAADHFESFFNLVKTSPEAIGVNPGEPVWFLTYRNGAAGEPLMVELFEKFGVKANIVYGNIDYFKGTVLGKLGVSLNGKVEAIRAAHDYLTQHNVHVEVLQ